MTITRTKLMKDTVIREEQETAAVTEYRDLKKSLRRLNQEHIARRAEDELLRRRSRHGLTQQ